MESKDLVAIITGAGKGIGKAIAEKLFEEGALVVLWVDIWICLKMLERLWILPIRERFP
jgi:short-subunit dehydrogenase involved in D-alanine esterification of teichoic acids